MTPIIELKHISKSFDQKTVLKDISLSINKGEFVTILGPSGCGKTTLLRMIAGFTEPDSGQLLLNGKEITDVPPYLRPVNTVFQKYALFPHLNVYDNIAFGLKLQKLKDEEIDQRVMQALKTVGMTDYEERNINELSGGQQQRVAIARAIVNRPQVLLLDEPLSALDHKMRCDMQIELKQMHKELGITFIFVTHDQEEALTLSDTIVVMNDAKIVQIGSPTQIYNEPKTPFVADFIGESNILNGTMIEDGKVEFLDQVFDCVDSGFAPNAPIDVVIRPEDIHIHAEEDYGQWRGTVTSCIFKGIHYEMLVQTPNGYEIQVQNLKEFPAGTEVGMSVKPEGIHVMECERLTNTFTATVVDAHHIQMLGHTWEVKDNIDVQREKQVTVTVDFDQVELTDNPQHGDIEGQIRSILYKGNHYFLGVKCANDEDIYLDSHDVWEDFDRVGIVLKSIKVIG